MTERAYIWLLNPDAEVEFGHVAAQQQGPYATPKRALASMVERRELFRPLTLDERALFLGEIDRSPFENTGAQVFVPWCPTPSLVARCEKYGIRLPARPPLSALLFANDKLRLSEFDVPVAEGRTLVASSSELKELLRSFEAVRLKRRFGFAGRAQRRLTATLSSDDERWVSDSLRAGRLVLEPELDIDELYSVHLMVTRTELLCGSPQLFQCDEFGAFSTWRDSTCPAPKESALRHFAERAGKKLIEFGYFGPAGLDFASTKDGQLCALDLNGRFSLGWSRGMGQRRQLALALYTNGAS